MNIPLPTNTFDGAICIAVIHHMSTEVRKTNKIKFDLKNLLFRIDD